MDSEQPTAIVEPRDLRGTAYHEAGHAVVAVALDVPFHAVTIDENDDAFGHVLYGVVTAFLNVGRRSAAAELRDYMRANRAGQLAELRATCRRNPDGWEDDDESFRETLWGMYGERWERHARDLTREAKQLVARHWPAIEHVAAALLAERTLSHGAVVAIVRPGE